MIMEEYIAISRNIKISPRKVRLVADTVKKNELKKALMALSLLDKRAAGPIKKAIESAMANAVNNFGKEKDNLTIKDIMVSEGLSYKRYHYASRGRVHPYKRRTSHIRVILAEKAGLPVKAAEMSQVKELESGKESEKKKGIRSRIRLPRGRKEESK